MYNDIVKWLIDKHLGAYKKSIYIGTDISMDGETYYYSLKNEERIIQIRELLENHYKDYGIDELPWLEQRFDDPVDNGKEITQCFCYSEIGGCWYLRIHSVIGVTYSNCNDGIVQAILLLSRHPMAVLCGDDVTRFFGYWGRSFEEDHKKEGFSYSLNKILLENKSFRDFTVDFFNQVAAIERKYILKDVAKAIEKCGFFLPEISYEKLLSYRNPAELIHSFSSECDDLNINFNKTDINTGYLITKFAAEIDKKDWHYLSQLEPNEIIKTITPDTLREGITTEQFVKKHLMNRTTVGGADIMVLGCVDDYIKLCNVMNVPFRINYDRNGIVRAHDDLSIRHRREANKQVLEKPLLKVPSQFDELEKAICKTGAVGFERICSMERLLEEGEYQHNCVFSRHDLVQKDVASIYRWDHNGESYTIQIEKNKNGYYFIREIRARFNELMSHEHFEDLRQIFDGICIVDCYYVKQKEINQSNPDEEYFEFDLPL